MALFAEVAELAEALAGEASRLKKRAAIAEAVRRHAATREQDAVADAGRFCLYLAGQPFPEADARKLNAGGAILSRALKAVSGASDAAMTAAYRRHGDLGAAAADLLSAPPGHAAGTATLTLAGIEADFASMAAARTTATRSALVEALLRGATAVEAKYLLKLMLGDMRIGVKQSLIEEGIAVAFGTTVEAVRHAVMLEADLRRAVTRASEGSLAEARMTLFHPLGFMLASPVETPQEAVERFTAKPVRKPAPAAKARKKGKKSQPEEEEEVADTAPTDTLPADAAELGYAEDVALAAATEPGDAAGSDTSETGETAGVTIHAFLEDKFDGIRAQVHCGDPAQPGRVAIYSRSREDITESFPELAEAFGQVDAPPSGLILDGEILGWDLAADKALPFAVLGQRIGRKRVDEAMRREIPVIFMAFDLMFASGDLQLPRALRDRREMLRNVAGGLESVVVAGLGAPPATAQAGLFADPETLADAVPRLRLSRAEMVEGADAVEQGYRDARARSNEGVMLKAAGSAYLPGRRGLAWLKLKRELATLDVVITGAEFGSGKRAQSLSDYTFAVRGPQGELLNLGKAYQGVTDAEIAELTEWLKAHTLQDFGHFRTVEPLRVIEIAFNNIMRSDRHNSGFALRFPRIVRLRDDKPVEEIDTLERVAEVYTSQPDKPSEG